MKTTTCAIKTRTFTAPRCAATAIEKKMLDRECFRLAPFVRHCVAGEALILLDLKHDRYHALSGRLAPVIGADGVVESGSAPSVMDSLSSAGIIVRGPPAPYVRRRKARPRAQHQADAFACAGALLRARALVNKRALQVATELIADLKAASASSKKVAPNTAIADAQRLFDELRIWAPWPYVCLVDSLALNDFLLGAGYETDLVIGVRAAPFAAHCWVEHKGEILNDGDETCSSFVEIARF